MILQATKNEVRIRHGFFLRDDLDVLGYSTLHHLHFFLLLDQSAKYVMREELGLGLFLYRLLS